MALRDASAFKKWLAHLLQSRQIYLAAVGSVDNFVLLAMLKTLLT